MRKIRIDGTPPQDWIDCANKITQQLHDAVDEVARKKILDDNEGLWRDDRIRNWLLKQFNNKCWYSEAYDSVSSVHVDHFRPKGRVTELDHTTCDGYWWLTFDWKNYRIAGQLINTKKHDKFPLISGHRAVSNDITTLELECYYLIDPLTEDVNLISYEKDEDACMAVPAIDIDQDDLKRVTQTIDIIGLNRLDKLNQKRLDFWDECIQQILKYTSSQGATSLKRINRKSATTELKKMINYKSEFSSVCMACIRKNAPEPVLAEVFSQE